MDTSREDVGIAIRSAFLSKGTQQKFSLFALILFSILLIFLESLQAKPINYVRSFIKDSIYRGSLIVSAPFSGISNINDGLFEHISLYKNYNKLKKENEELKNSISKSDFLELENSQLRILIDEQASSQSNLVSARVLIDKQSPYLNSFIINIGSNKDIKNGMAVLHGKNFIGRIIDVNFFSSRVLLVSDLNSRVPVIVEPTGVHSILNGDGKNLPILEYLPENHNLSDGRKVYTSGKAGIFSPGLQIGEVKIEDNLIKVNLYSDLSQITFVNINLGEKYKKK